MSQSREWLAHLRLTIAIARSDLRARYSLSALGFLWAVLVPVFLMLVFYLVFGHILGMRSAGEYPYPAFLLCGLFPWNFLALSLSTGTAIVSDASNLLKRVPIPAETIPLSVIVSNLPAFVVSMLLLAIVMVAMGLAPWGGLWLVPVVLLLDIFLVAGIVLLVSGLHVHLRDVRYVVDLLLLFWFYTTPIFYPATMISRTGAPAWAERLFLLNPMGALAMLSRVAFLDGYAERLPLGTTVGGLILTASVVSLAMLALGWRIFGICRRTFADVL